MTGGRLLWGGGELNGNYRLLNPMTERQDAIRTSSFGMPLGSFSRRRQRPGVSRGRLKRVKKRDRRTIGGGIPAQRQRTTRTPVLAERPHECGRSGRARGEELPESLVWAQELNPPLLGSRTGDVKEKGACHAGSRRTSGLH